MPGKKKSAKKGGKTRASTGSKKKKSAKGGKGRATSAPAAAGLSDVPEREPDMMDPPAMENLYYIAHTAVDALEIRGFGWANAPKGKKKKKGKKK